VAVRCSGLGFLKSTPSICKELAMTSRTGHIRALNDELRSTGSGGITVVTRGIAALSTPDLAAVIAAIQRFDDFSVANDPYGEHDCAVLEVAGQRVMFKIDYFDLTFNGHSADPADPLLTLRVMTIMLASEY
jgi:hypothetical protein